MTTVEREPGAILVERTAKRWKRRTLYGLAAIAAGAVLAMATDYSGTGALAMAVGLGLVIRAKLGAWWHHG